jgi:hypothetical protein
MKHNNQLVITTINYKIKRKQMLNKIKLRKEWLEKILTMSILQSKVKL